MYQTESHGTTEGHGNNSHLNNTGEYNVTRSTPQDRNRSESPLPVLHYQAGINQVEYRITMEIELQMAITHNSQ